MFICQSYDNKSVFTSIGVTSAFLPIWKLIGWPSRDLTADSAGCFAPTAVHRRLM